MHCTLEGPGTNALPLLVNSGAVFEFEIQHEFLHWLNVQEHVLKHVATCEHAFVIPVPLEIDPTIRTFQCLFMILGSTGCNP